MSTFFNKDTPDAAHISNILTITGKVFLLKVKCNIHDENIWLCDSAELDLMSSLTHQVISEMIFPANHLTGAKHPAFSTNHLADIDKTKHNQNNNKI